MYGPNYKVPEGLLSYSGSVNATCLPSILPRALPDFILQLWTEIDFSPQVPDKIWE